MSLDALEVFDFIRTQPGGRPLAREISKTIGMKLRRVRRARRELMREGYVVSRRKR